MTFPAGRQAVCILQWWRPWERLGAFAFTLGLLLPLSGGVEARPASTTSTAKIDCSAPPPDVSSLPPLAKQTTGLAAQTGYSVNLMLKEGRERLGDIHQQGGTTEDYLRELREKAMLHSIVCGSSDLHYRSGVCFDFQQQCQHHGGGGCDACVRAWGAQYCQAFLQRTVNVPVDALKDKLDPDEEWSQLLSIAREMNDPQLLQDLDRARETMINKPIEANCHALFF